MKDIRKSLSEQKKAEAKSDSAEDKYDNKKKEGEPLMEGNAVDTIDWESIEDKAVDQMTKKKLSKDYNFHDDDDDDGEDDDGDDDDHDDDDGGDGDDSRDDDGDVKHLHVTDKEQENRMHKDDNIVITSLKTISKVQRAIVSILTQVEEERMHGKICNLLGLSKLLASLNIAKASINPLKSENHLTSWNEATSLMYSGIPKAR